MGDGIPMDKIKDKIRNLSVRKTILLCLMISLTISFFLSAYITRTAYKVQERIWWKYTEKNSYFNIVEKENKGYVVKIPRPTRYEMSAFDYGISEACDFVQTYSVLFISLVGSCSTVFFFTEISWRNQLRNWKWLQKELPTMI